MKKFKVVLAKKAQKDLRKILRSQYSDKVRGILAEIETDPYSPNFQFEKLEGNLQGFYSKRINIQHRIVYQVFEQDNIVVIDSAWTHYE